MKAVMVIAVTFGPQNRTAGLVTPLVCTTVLFAVTLAWFGTSTARLLAHLVDARTWSEGLSIASPEPCTLPVSRPAVADRVAHVVVMGVVRLCQVFLSHL